ncbi:HotDog domain-containing protein [Rhodocollybia butyracea]|uniref:HotDog domain-containing protein n=1 Tax=Rhodocollybia butyracea TaxID=206335 RepID=A0A9P5UDL3_9AGAR|nr:HotDog domain-containing protein [Rhodocollybia butyracea]
MSETQNLKSLGRADFKYSLTYRTRWSDNDQYSHINNSIYYHFFDSIVNTYLIESCGQNPQQSPSIGLVISSWCQYFAPLSFPDVLDFCLRVKKLGSSSVTYEIGVFKQGSNIPAAVGGYTHVFVDRESRKSITLQPLTRHGLSALLVSDGAKL